MFGKTLLVWLHLSEVKLLMRKDIRFFAILILVLQSVFFMICCKNQTDSIELAKNDSKKRITLMIYMAADNDLESYALQNLKQLENGKSDEVNVLVLLDRAEGYDETDGNWTDTRLFEVVSDDGDTCEIKSRRLDCPALGLAASQNTELDMGKSSVLKALIEFGKANYEAEKYALIIWGHGSGWKAFAIDERSKSYMSVKELGQAVRGMELCVIGFDTCFGGVIENLYELKDCADYTVACSGVSPNRGWNYKTLMTGLAQTSGESLASQKIAEVMQKSSEAETGIFINEKLASLFTSFEAFSKALSDTIIDSPDRRQTLSNLLTCRSYCYSQNPCDLYLDIFSMAELYSSSSDVTLAQNSQKLKKSVGEASLSQNKGLGVHFIPKSSSGALSASHSLDYVKDSRRSDQNSFIEESLWWVPTVNGDSGSLLDKLFYSGI